MSHLVKIASSGTRLAAEATDWPIVLCESPVAKALSPTGNGYEFHVPKIGRKNWGDAVAYGQAFADFNGGWQLVDVPETHLIIDLDRYGPAADPTFFPTLKSDWYWTRRPAAWSPRDGAWIVSFYYGHSYGVHQDDEYRVLLSRPRQ